MKLQFKNWLLSQLETSHKQHQYRQRSVVEPLSGVCVRVGQQNCINFCSNDYLGLANDPALKLAQQQAVEKYGVGAGASQLITGFSSAHEALENEMAEFLGRPRVLLFSSGYLANLGVMTVLSGRQDAIFLDRLSHASLIDGARYSEASFKRYRHCDMSDLNRQLQKNKSASMLIVSDGVFSMDGDIAPIQSFCQTAARYDAVSIVDDAHGIGVLGKTARGSVEHSGVNMSEVDLLIGTFGKAFGTCGAFVSGSHEIIDSLIQAARTLIYTTALPAAISATTRSSLKLIQTERWRQEKLEENVSYFRKQAQAQNIILSDSVTAIQPIIIGDSQQALSVSSELKNQGILVSAIRPPTVPNNSARLRVTLSTAHSKEQIDQLVAVLGESLSDQAVKL